ncbi:hypothetical protein KEM55_000734, partial [Ascosphaera atra]
SPGLMHAIIAVLLLPPRLSFSSHVSTESRYGTTLLLPSVDDSFLLLLLFPCLPLPPSTPANAAITLPNVVSDRLILLPSLNLWPFASILPVLSLPARSTSRIRAVRSVVSSLARSCWICFSITVNTACDRELVSFIFVAAVVRAPSPRRISVMISDRLRTGRSVRSLT